MGSEMCIRDRLRKHQISIALLDYPKNARFVICNATALTNARFKVDRQGSEILLGEDEPVEEPETVLAIVTEKQFQSCPKHGILFMVFTG